MFGAATFGAATQPAFVRQVVDDDEDDDEVKHKEEADKKQKTGEAAAAAKTKEEEEEESEDEWSESSEDDDEDDDDDGGLGFADEDEVKHGDETRRKKARPVGCKVRYDIGRLCMSEKFADVRFEVGPKGGTETFSAHKIILASRSPVFAAMLFSRFQEATTSEAIRVPDISPECFRILLECVYSDRADLSPENAIGVLMAAKKYQVEPLRKACVAYMSDDIAVDNIVVLLNNFSDLLDEEQFTLRFLEQHATEIVEHSTFTDLQKRNVKLILSNDYLAADEVVLFRALMKWAAAEAKRNDKNELSLQDLRETVADLLPLVRFPIMSMEDMLRVVLPTRILSDQHALRLLHQIAESSDGSSSAGSSGGAPGVEWFCARCTLRNTPMATKCMACGSTDRQKVSSWKCAQCTYVNAANAAACVMCKGTRREAVASAAADDNQPAALPYSSKPRVPRVQTFSSAFMPIQSNLNNNNNNWNYNNNRLQQSMLKINSQSNIITSTRHSNGGGFGYNPRSQLDFVVASQRFEANKPYGVVQSQITVMAMPSRQQTKLGILLGVQQMGLADYTAVSLNDSSTMVLDCTSWQISGGSLYRGGGWTATEFRAGAPKPIKVGTKIGIRIDFVHGYIDYFVDGQHATRAFNKVTRPSRLLIGLGPQASIRVDKKFADLRLPADEEKK